MIYYTSDLHLGHANAITFDNRLFADVEEMDRTLMATGMPVSRRTTTCISSVTSAISPDILPIGT